MDKRLDFVKRVYDYLEKNNRDWHKKLEKTEKHRLERMIWEISRLKVEDFYVSKDEEGYFYWILYLVSGPIVSIDMMTTGETEDCVFSIHTRKKDLLVQDSLDLCTLIDKLDEVTNSI